MTVVKFVQPTAAQSGATYKSNINSSIQVVAEIAGHFAPHAQDTPDLTVRVDAGRIYWRTGSPETLIEKAAQNTASLTAPTVNPRKDIVHIDQATGNVGVATGAEAAAPVDPGIPAGKIPIGRITWTVAAGSITNSMISDLRTAFMW